MSDRQDNTSGSQSQSRTQSQSQSQSQTGSQTPSSPGESPAPPVTEEQDGPSSSNTSSTAAIGGVQQGAEDQEPQGDRAVHRDEFGTQRVYKKTSPNCVLTLYLPSREITLTGNNSSVLRGIVFVDPKAIQGYRVYAQLTLTFRYGREDEEVMGLRFCNEAIMSLHQIWPRLEEPTRDSLSPLQEALLKRLGDGAHPFTLTLTAQAPPSVQLVPAKRYYGAPIGTSYDVRCFIEDESDSERSERSPRCRRHQGHNPTPNSSTGSSRNQNPSDNPNGSSNENPSDPLPDSSPNPAPNLQTSPRLKRRLRRGRRLRARPRFSPRLIRRASRRAAQRSNFLFRCVMRLLRACSCCFCNSSEADKTDEKFHRRASVKMGVRVIYRTDVFHHHSGPVNCAAYASQQSPPVSSTPPSSSDAQPTGVSASQDQQPSTSSGCKSAKSKSERGDSFPKLRLSPKSFRFSGRFGRSKSEIEKCPNDAFHCYSKSFQEHCDSTGCGVLPPHSNAGVTGGVGGISVGPCGGPQGSVDKPFLLHDGRVGLRASLDKGWYTHGENVNVSVNILNDSRKTVRKVRVCAIQHVDVCMFNNGKFKNVVADSDNLSPPVERVVPPGGTLNTTVALRPQRGPTKNWIALEDTLQRSTEPDEITGAIAASAIRSPNFFAQAAQLLTGCPLASPAMAVPQAPQGHPQAQAGAAGNASSSGSVSGSASNSSGVTGFGEDRNVFAIYVSYYVKVKVTLSGMGGELSLKLPFVLVHVDESKRPGYTSATLGELRLEKMALHDAPVGRNKNGRRGSRANIGDGPSTSAAAAAAAAAVVDDDAIETLDEDFNICLPVPPIPKRRLQRSETVARDLEIDDDDVDYIDEEDDDDDADTDNDNDNDNDNDEDDDDGENVDGYDEDPDVEEHVVQVHVALPENEPKTGTTPKSTNV